MDVLREPVLDVREVGWERVALRALPELDLAMLGKAWDEGKASGSAGALDVAEIIAEACVERDV